MFDSLIDHLARFCLKFGHITFIFPIVLVCIIFGRREIYAKATCFLLWVMIFNTLLKHVFKVPLFPHLGTGYAFPSGHMHAAAAFYGYILYKTDSKLLKIGLFTLLGCFGFSLIHCHFHDLMDVMGAVGFAVSEFVIYHVISTKFGDKVVGVLAVLSAVATMIALNIIYKIEFHVWLAFYGLVGMEIASLVFPKKPILSVLQKVLALLVSMITIAGIYYLFRVCSFSRFYLSEVRFMLTPLAIAGSLRLAEQVKL